MSDNRNKNKNRLCFHCENQTNMKYLSNFLLHSKYLTSKDFYNVKIINDIIYNEPTNIVAVFKDYLIYDDASEFLKRYYADDESSPRLPRILDYYDKFSKVFPNYIILDKSNIYLYKNIERKQRAIDERQRRI